MNSLHNKRILLGVTGGISAYKSADLTRRLRDAGAEVRVVMTEAATGFVAPLTFQALSGNPVRWRLDDPAAEMAMGHIELARWADAIMVAPASADFIARLAAGRADDLLSTVCLATRAPVALAPAMNQAMWSNAATCANVETLKERDIRLFGPAVGAQACGETGPGRMLEPGALVDRLSALFETGALAGLSVVLTAGPTREPIDPVRYIGNRSSGRMGYALAEACAEAGANVTLISGPVAIKPPERLARQINVETAGQMYDAVIAAAGHCDIFIGVAAVCDYRPVEPVEQKLKKNGARIHLSLEENPDIVGAVATLPLRPFTVGFAAETGNVAQYACAKLNAKGLDLIAANRVGAGAGFDSEQNQLDIYWQGGHRHLPLDSKKNLSRQLVALIADRYRIQLTVDQQETREPHVQGTTEDT